MIVMSALINVPVPVMVLSFYNVLIEVAAMDIFHGEDIMGLISFKETTQISD